jgi:AGCS family alanine or glycine:cation symporter
MIREGFVAMLGPFIDTLLICTMTALVILSADCWQVRDASGEIVYGIGAENSYCSVDGTQVIADRQGDPVTDDDGHYYELPIGASLTAESFGEGFRFGRFIVAIGLVLFAYSTMISWSYYGDRCAEFLLGPRAILPYRGLYVILIVFGACGGLQTIWLVADLFNALMAIPNLISLLVLGGLVAHETKDYLRRLDKKEF